MLVGILLGMRILVAGASGVIGRQLVPLLVESGHEVTGMTRSEAKADHIRAAGAMPVVADALDSEAVALAVREAAPEVAIHQLTAIPRAIDVRRFAQEFEATNRVRREGTRNLVDAARAAGARRIVAQSIAQAYAPEGGWVKPEEAPLYADAPEAFGDVFDAVVALESEVLDSGLESVVLRYGTFYGPGTAYAADGSNADLVRAGRYPIAGDGTGRLSFIHVADAARATVAAIETSEEGVFNVVDDEPAALAEWLPAYAEALGAPVPQRTPAPQAEFGAYAALHARAASNEKAKRSLGWEPVYTSWRQGFTAELTESSERE